MDALIPIVAIICTIGLPAIVVIIMVVLGHRRRIARLDLLEKAIATETSPEVLKELIATIGEQEKKSSPPREKHLTHATILLALGISSFILKLIAGAGQGIWLLYAGAILAMLGIAKLIIAFFISSKKTVEHQ